MGFPYEVAERPVSRAHHNGRSGRHPERQTASDGYASKRMLLTDALGAIRR